jgi:hypothetical protein
MKGVFSLLAVKMLTGLGSGLFHAIFALVSVTDVLLSLLKLKGD